MCRFLIIYADVIFAKRQKKLRLSGMIYRVLIIYADVAFAKRQKKLRLSGMIYRVLIIYADVVFAKRQKRLQLSGSLFNQSAPQAHRFSSIFSLIFSLKKAARRRLFSSYIYR